MLVGHVVMAGTLGCAVPFGGPAVAGAGPPGPGVYRASAVCGLGGQRYPACTLVPLYRCAAVLLHIYSGSRGNSALG